MKARLNFNLFLVLFVILFVGCETHHKCDKVDPQQAEQLIIDFLQATNESDFEKIKNITTDDYLVYLDGEVFDHDKLVEFLEDFPEEANYLFEEFDFDIESDCNSAFIKYYCYVMDTKLDTIKIKTYSLQSAHIMRVGDELKLNLIHSTSERLGFHYQTLLSRK